MGGGGRGRRPLNEGAEAYRLFEAREAGAL